MSTSRHESKSTSSDSEDDDNTWDDWISESGSRQCQSLFEKRVFPTAAETIAYDRSMYDFDLFQFSQNLGLDFYGRTRLINYIRKEQVSPLVLQGLTGQEAFLTEDVYLKPALEDDPLLEFDDTEWSEPEIEQTLSMETASAKDYQHRIKNLEEQLFLSTKSLQEYQTIMKKCLGLDEDIASSTKDNTRDDDTHYFRSYSDSEIHAVMIEDAVRTSTYASFILSNPAIFENAIVLDVGCGTGILSLFAARAGAKHVYAVDASDIAEKAESIVKANGFGEVITVIKGKVESITLPIQKVDVIISEWMGYALLYESMLDSVLHARDRFLKPGGLIAPSESRMLLALCDASEILKDRVCFWEDVYGFDMSAMSEGIYDDAVLDVVPSEALLSSSECIKTLNTYTLTVQELDFAAPFTLTSTSSRKTKAHAFLLYFDVIFNVLPDIVGPNFEVQTVQAGKGELAEVWPIGQGRGPLKRRFSSKASEHEMTLDMASRGKLSSFSTGPMSVPTHWKQTLFLLREPIPISEGTIVQGSFHCRKSPDNSRELDIEVHFTIHAADGRGDIHPTIVRLYKVR